MRSLLLIITLFYTSCRPKVDLRENVAIIQWDLRDRLDSIPGPDFLMLPKIILFKNNKIYVYRISKTKVIRTDGQYFEFGKCQNEIPFSILTQANSVNPDNFDTLYYDQYSERISHKLKYAVVDLRSGKFSLFAAGDIDTTTLHSINNLLSYTDTVTITNSSDSSDLKDLRKTIFNIAKRRFFPKEIIYNDSITKHINYP